MKEEKEEGREGRRKRRRAYVYGLGKSVQYIWLKLCC
jgi:hypothetical protein